MNFYKLRYLLALLTIGMVASSCTATQHAHNYTDPYHPKYKSNKLSSLPQIDDDTLKVVTYNIKFSNNVAEAIKLLLKSPELQDADIICLQEMDSLGVRRIAHALEYNYIYYPAVFHPGLNKEFGNAILSKWPIDEDKKLILPLPDSKRLQRIAVKASIHIKGRDVMVYSVHKEVHIDHKVRSNQAKSIVESIPDSAEYVVIAGDFNTFTEKSIKSIEQTFSSAELKLVTKDVGWTYNHWYLLNKKSTLDHIFAKKMTVAKVGKVMNRTASDHVPVWAHLEFEEPDSARLVQTPSPNSAISN